MSLAAHPVRLDVVDRTNDGGNATQPSPSTTTSPVAAAIARAARGSADRSAADAVPFPHDWYRRLGASHRKRDDANRRAARIIQDRDDTRELACRRRWPAIVAAMRTLVWCYNDGTGRETLVLVDDDTRQDGELIATVTAPNGQRLVLAVDGADLWVRPERQNGEAQSERWIGVDRSNEATAAYILQHWLTRL